MRVLQVCHKPSFPPVEGGAIAMYNLAKGIKNSGHHIDVIAMNTHKQYCDSNTLKYPLDFCETYYLVDVDIRIKPFSAFKNLFSSRSYNIERFQNDEFEKLLFDLIENSHYDAIILESLFSTHYVDKLNKEYGGKLILRSHNVEFQIWENLSLRVKNPLKKWYLNLLAKRLKTYEFETINKVDSIACISQDDLADFKSFNCKTNLYHLKFGIDFESLKYNFDSSSPQLKIYHVGSMNWIPHQEAFKWFFDHVWPRIKSFENMKVFLAGAFMPAWIDSQKNQKLEVVSGYVNGLEYMKDKHILIVPSFSGSGIRIKIIEAMASGKVVLTNSNGTIGIDVKINENILVSDSASEWAEKIQELETNRQKLEDISKKAFEYARQNHNYIQIAKEFMMTLESRKQKPTNIE